MKQQHLHSLLAALLGASLTLGYAPWSVWFIVPFIIAAFITLLRQSPVPGHHLGFCFGFGWFGAGISWVHVSIEQFGGFPLAGSAGLMVLLCAYLALYPALAFALVKRYAAPAQWWYALPVIWFIAEWLRSWVLTGFPWLALGYTQTQGPFAWWAPIVGETGLSMLLMTTAALLSRFVQQQKWIYTSLTVLFFLMSGLLVKQINWIQPGDKHYTIAMVQGNIKQELRWVPEQDEPTMRKYLALTEPHWNADIIIWPEAAIPKIEPLAQQYLHALDSQALSSNTGLITGIVNYNFEDQRAYNTLITLGVDDPKRTAVQLNSTAPSFQTETIKPTHNPQHFNNEALNSPNELPDAPPPPQTTTPQQVAQYYYQHSNRYAKHHLLPIGEFIPLENWIRGLAPLFDLPMSSFSRGDYEQTNLLVNGARFVPAICFEIAFPQQIRANLRQHSNFIITVSNDAWFGNSHGPHQHLEIAQMRAMELGIPVLRATNNGITAFINSNGSIANQAPQFEDATVVQTVHTSQGITPYRYLGELPHWLVVWLVGGLLLFQYRRQPPTR